MSSTSRFGWRWSGVLALVLCASLAHAEAALSVITVKITGLRSEEGQALVALYDSPQTWLKIPKASQVVHAKITGNALTIEFKDVKPGTYAVSVIHDENKNNELDMRWLPWPKPKEGVAVSNDPENRAGPPKWDGAKFEVTKSVTVKATLKYL